MAEKIESTGITRVLYYKGQALTAKDFQDEQTYHSEKLRQLLMRFQPGVIRGMAVKPAEQVVPFKSITIDCGVGVNRNGDFLCIFPGQMVFINDNALPTQVEEDYIKVPNSEIFKKKSNKLYVNIAFRESKRVEAVAFAGSIAKNNRVDETITISIDSSPALNNDAITIGVLLVQPDGESFIIDYDSPVRLDAKMVPENDIVFDEFNGHDHSGNKKGKNIEASGLKDGAVISGKIAENAVSNKNIEAKTITIDKLNPDALKVSGIDIEGTYPELHIKKDSIVSEKIKTWDLQSGPDDDKYPNGTGIRTSHIRNEAVTLDKLASEVKEAKMGDLEGFYPNPSIRENAIKTDKIEVWKKDVFGDNSGGTGIRTSHLRDGAVTKEKLDPKINIPITGVAGGDLTERYPNPRIANWDGVSGPNEQSDRYTGIRTDHIRKGAVTQDKLDPSIVFKPSGPVIGGDLIGQYPGPRIAPWDESSGPNEEGDGKTGIRTAHIRNRAITIEKFATEAKKLLGDIEGIYPDMKIRNWDGGTLPDDPNGSGIKTSHIRNRAVRSEKLDIILDKPPNFSFVKGTYNAIVRINNDALFQVIPVGLNERLSWKTLETTCIGENLLQLLVEIIIYNDQPIEVIFRIFKFGKCENGIGMGEITKIT